jgi:hypothetical protein
MIAIDVERLLELYEGVDHRSLRLECRQAYAVPWEDERVAAWRRGEPEPPSPSSEENQARIRAITASGRRVARVRFVELPMTEYTRRQFETAYPQSTAAGEEIFVVDRAAHPEFDHVREDFVVFDDTALMYYRYTDDDRLTGYEYSDDPVLVAEHLALAEEVLAAATPLAEWSQRAR